jgi:predicted small metal-binding protein
MKRFRCGDVVPGCTAVFNEPTEDQILSAVASHALHDHGISEIPPALVARVRSLIQEVPTAA